MFTSLSKASSLSASKTQSGLTPLVQPLLSRRIAARYIYSKETGEIIWINSEVMDNDELEEIDNYLEEHDCCHLPSSYEINNYSIMEAFTDTRSGEEFDKLARALKGRGAFRRFKDTVNWLGIDQEWYDFQDNEYKRIAIKWCENNNIEYEE